MSRPLRAAAAALLCLAAVYALVRVDLDLRARAAYQEGEKYLLWAQNPALKKSYYDGELARQEAALQKQYRAGSLGADELKQKMELAQIRRDQAVAESSLKYAYVWFETGAELFSPPENRWTKLCRREMPKAKALWEKQLQAEKIPYKDYMLE
ncbi:MAG TPA: hypothetical protein VNK24_03370 [Elusimicrobiota bacterium]|nr:hypothetical protein [Elusimicrobiota bacterium]